MKPQKILLSSTALIAALGLTACGSSSSSSNSVIEISSDLPPDGGSNSETTTKITAIAVGTTADYSSSSMATLETEAPYTASTQIGADSNSDVAISGYGDNIYRIARYGANFITKYDASDLTTPIWQCSTEGDDTNSNPYQLIQVSDSKAYVLRYGTGKIWVVNPAITDSSLCETEFKIGEIDLSAFDSDGVPDMSSGVVVDGKLFVTIQRLQSFRPTQTSQVAVIDTKTDTLIDVDPATSGTQAINLIGRNPGKIIYQADLDQLFVQSVGAYEITWTDPVTPAKYTGGIDAIDPSSYTVTQKVDDDADTLQLSDMALVSDTKGYLVGYAGFKNNTLYQFNPTDGSLTRDANTQITAIAGITGENIAGIYYEANSKQLWIATTSGFKLLNTEDNTVTESLLDTQMNPSGLFFHSKTAENE